MRVWLWLVYKFTENYCRLRLFSEFIQTQRRYPTSLNKTAILTYCHIKLKFFLWTKLLESLLLAKYLISAAANLITLRWNEVFYGPQLSKHIFHTWSSRELLAFGDEKFSCPTLDTVKLSWYWDTSENKAKTIMVKLAFKASC